MIEKLSPTLELALQNELRQAYLKGVETGRRMEQDEQKLREAVYGNIIDASDGSAFHRDA